MKRPQDEPPGAVSLYFCGVANATSWIRALRYDSRMLKTGLGQEFGGSAMTAQLEASTLYSLAGTILSLAVTWFFVTHSFVQPMVA
jgi:hypothetical protein